AARTRRTLHSARPAARRVPLPSHEQDGRRTPSPRSRLGPHPCTLRAHAAAAPASGGAAPYRPAEERGIVHAGGAGAGGGAPRRGSEALRVGDAPVPAEPALAQRPRLRATPVFRRDVTAPRAVRVYFPCTGLGRQRRGLETFTRSCAAALRGEPGLEITVFGGGGPDSLPDERAVPNAPRDGLTARAVGALTRRDPYFIEQATFFAAFRPRLVAAPPDVVYFADLSLGNACWHWRRISGQRFRLLFYNGGATTKPFTRCDLVQHVSPEHFDSALARGERADHQVLLPHGVDVADDFVPPTSAQRAAAKQELGIAPGRPLLLSVGMLDVEVK